MRHFEVVCIEEEYGKVEIGKIYTVIDILAAGSSEETYIIERKHPDGKSLFRGIPVFLVRKSRLFVRLDEWREMQIKKIGL
jgi:hypothetical protein